ncbi:hypothetical protein C1N62_22635 (plasmid) [Nissabacter sp. SGAir0207]|nr:hypothetical protein C1N62_22635 [Nissabacter sp. SGAir0207]
MQDMIPSYHNAKERITCYTELVKITAIEGPEIFPGTKALAHKVTGERLTRDGEPTGHLLTFLAPLGRGVEGGRFLSPCRYYDHEPTDVFINDVLEVILDEVTNDATGCTEFDLVGSCFAMKYFSDPEIRNDRLWPECYLNPPSQEEDAFF